MNRRLLIVLSLVSMLAAGAVALAAAPKAPAKAPAATPAPAKTAEVTDEAVCLAIDKALAYLTKMQQADGTWPEKTYYHAPRPVGTSELCLMALIYCGTHPNRDVVAKALDPVLSREPEYVYAVCARAMALAHVQNKFTGAKRDHVREALKRDVLWLVTTQGPGGGWGYTGLGGEKASRNYQDLSNTQMVVLALREAAAAGVEIPQPTWQRVQDLYFRSQKSDGGWNYGETDNRVGGAGRDSYGSMTAAGLASVFITSDNLDTASGCPCRGKVSARIGGDVDRRIDSALGWLEKNFKVDSNPGGGPTFGSRVHYWLYSVERVGDAAGYKYFGGHNWFKEAAAYLLKAQKADGSWDGEYGALVTTSFSALFLYKGRGPILFNKLQFDGQWNNHRRDIANLTQHIARLKEQPCHWQIVNLRATREELHDAPILFITPEDAPKFTDAQKRRLREFTDTGGTLLLEASCGNPAPKKCLEDLARELWPEWPLKDLPPEHPSFADPYPLKTRPAVQGAHDGLRTFLFYAPDDISCAWHLKALLQRGYLFEWGINLVAYATDGAPLRAKLASEPKVEPRHTQAVAAGPKKTVRIARVRHTGDWAVNANYKGFARLADRVKAKAGVALEVNDDGVAPADLAGFDAAYLAGTRAFALDGPQVEALKAFAARGGFLWFEAAGGAAEFHGSMQKLAQDAGWRLELLPKSHAIMTGRMTPATGYDLTKDLKFRKALKILRGARPEAELWGVFTGDKLIGIYSPIDIMFSVNPYEAYQCKGYETVDAAAVATNLVLYLTASGAATPPKQP